MGEHKVGLTVSFTWGIFFFIVCLCCTFQFQVLLPFVFVHFEVFFVDFFL